MFNSVYDLNLYKIFYVCSISKSFSETAEKMNLTQPAISYSIRQLEEQLKVTLFVRTNSGIELTKEGKALLYYVEKANSLLMSGNKILEEIRNEEVFEINVGVPTHVGAYYFIKYLKVFNDKHPNVRVNIIDKKTSEMLLMLENKELDLLIDTDLTENNNKNIRVDKIKDFKGIFVGNDSFVELGKKNIVTAKELEIYPLILPSTTTTTRKLLDSNFRRKNVLLKSIIETNSSPIAKEIIEAGIGIGWMISEFVQTEINEKKFVEIKTDVDNVMIPISVAYQEKNINKIIKDFINIIKEN
ncbi:MAG: LysR family transcriptional regulator [bacterium]|nr:LysR family transcriptional regulator [bacterium]